MPRGRARPALLEPHALAFTSIYPELTEFGGGGSGQSGDDVSTDAEGIPHRALSLRATYAVSIARLTVSLTISNHSTRRVDADVAWILDADFADIQEAHEGKRDQRGDVHRQVAGDRLTFTYQHPQLKYRTAVAPIGPRPWTVSESTIETRIRLEPQEAVVLGLQAGRVRHERRGGVQRCRGARAAPPDMAGAPDARRHSRRTASRNGSSQANVRDFASFPLLEGPPDEWLTLQAGMPLYPALFGRDTLTAGWQAAYLDRGESLDASLTRLGRMQSDRVYDWRDEEPGRIPYQVRRGPLALLDVNPYSAYYADFASPLMFVISLAHLYAWTGDRQLHPAALGCGAPHSRLGPHVRRQGRRRISRIPHAIDEGHEEPGLERQRRCHRL